MVDRDWYEWHLQYEDPDSHLAPRLATVQSRIRAALDEVLGVVGLVAATGLILKTRWGRPAVVAVGALNVIGAVTAFFAHWTAPRSGSRSAPSDWSSGCSPPTPAPPARSPPPDHSPYGYRRARTRKVHSALFPRGTVRVGP